MLQFSILRIPLGTQTFANYSYINECFHLVLRNIQETRKSSCFCAFCWKCYKLKKIYILSWSWNDLFIFFVVAGKHTHFQVCSPRRQHRSFNLFIIRLRLCLTYAVYYSMNKRLFQNAFKQFRFEHRSGTFCHIHLQNPKLHVKPSGWEFTAQQAIQSIWWESVGLEVCVINNYQSQKPKIFSQDVTKTNM